MQMASQGTKSRE